MPGRSRLQSVRYDRHGRIAKRCRAAASRLHDVECASCRRTWQAEHPFCERVECPGCGRLIQVNPDPSESNFFVPPESLPAVAMLR